MIKPVPTLFLFNNIFFPQTVIPLTVIDNISKKMLINCYQNSIDIALYHPHRRSIGVATLAKIILVEHNDDGNLNIVVQGLMRIKLLSMDNENPYPQYLTSDYFDLGEKSQISTDASLSTPLFWTQS